MTMSLFVREGIAKLLSLVSSSSGKYVCFTRLSKGEDTLFLCVTDGADVWQLALSEEDIDAYKGVAQVASRGAYLGRIRSAFEHDELQISVIAQRILLTVGVGSAAFTLDLYQTTAQEKKEQFQFLVFRLAGNVLDLQSELKKSDEKIQSFEKQRRTDDRSMTSPIQEPDMKRSKLNKPKHKKGHSIINPGTRRTKAAEGVVFD